MPKKSLRKRSWPGSDWRWSSSVVVNQAWIWSHFTSFLKFQQIHITSVSGHWKHFVSKIIPMHYARNIYLNDLDRGRIDGDRRPSSSIRLGFESLEEKWRWNIRGSSLANPPPGPTGVPMGVPAGAGVVAWCPVPPEAAAAAPNWCNRSWEEHWDWNYNRVIYYGLEWAKVIHP